MNAENYIEMFDKVTSRIVRVYNICTNPNGKIWAVIYDAGSEKDGRNGWKSMKMNRLLPVDMVNSSGKVMSKTYRNKIKSLLKLNMAEWVCTDGKSFMSFADDGHTGLQEAIKHQDYIENCEEDMNTKNLNDEQPSVM